METIADRIKQIRKKNKLKQWEFGERINVKRNTVATYEMGRSTPSDAAIALICREFGISEEWLRTGKGQKENNNEKDYKLKLWVDNVLKGRPNSFKKRLLMLLSVLDESDWTYLEKIEQKARELLEEENNSDLPEPMPTMQNQETRDKNNEITDEDYAKINRQTELYHNQLIEEKRQESQALFVNESDAG